MSVASSIWVRVWRGMAVLDCQDRLSPKVPQIHHSFVWFFPCPPDNAVVVHTADLAVRVWRCDQLFLARLVFVFPRVNQILKSEEVTRWYKVLRCHNFLKNAVCRFCNSRANRVEVFQGRLEMCSTVVTRREDHADVHGKPVQLKELSQLLLGFVVGNHVLSCQQIKTVFACPYLKTLVVGFRSSDLFFFLIPRLFVNEDRVFRLGIFLWRYEISSWRHDIRQSIDRNDLG